MPPPGERSDDSSHGTPSRALRLRGDDRTRGNVYFPRSSRRHARPSIGLPTDAVPREQLRPIPTRRPFALTAHFFRA
jgi:hypothetical protein